VAKHFEEVLQRGYLLNSKEISRRTLNPHVAKFFEVAALQMEKHLYDKYIGALEDYLRFLLGFAMRDSGFRECPEFSKFEFESLRVRIE